MAKLMLYVRIRGKVMGPFDQAQLEALRDRGQLHKFHEISTDRVSWRSAATATELFAVETPPAPVPEAHPVDLLPAQPREAMPHPVEAPGRPDMVWHFAAADGRQLGPVTAEELAMSLARGVVTEATLIWRAGMSGWQPLGQVAEIVGQRASRPAPAGKGTGAGFAWTSVVLGPLWLGGIGSILGLVFGILALRQARRVPGSGARGLALAGVLLSTFTLLATPPAVWLGWKLIYGGRLSNSASAQEITEKYKQSVYTVKTENSTGSGILLANNKSRGLIVTNLHVLSEELEKKPELKRLTAAKLPKETVQVKNSTQLNFLSARVAAFHRDVDLALLIIEMDAEKPAWVPIIRRRGLKQGETAVALGNPHGLEFFTSSGVISSTSGEGGYIWTTCPISPGNSGGPLFLSRHGYLAGLNTIARVGNFAQNLNGAVPAEEIVASLRARNTDVWVWAPDLKDLTLELIDLVPLED